MLLTMQIQLQWMRLKDIHEWWVGTGLEGGNQGLLEGIYHTIHLTDRGKLWKVLFRTRRRMDKAHSRNLPNTSLAWYCCTNLLSATLDCLYKRVACQGSYVYFTCARYGNIRVNEVMVKLSLCFNWAPCHEGCIEGVEA